MKKFVTAVLLLSFLISMLPSVSLAAVVTPKLYLNGIQLQTKAEPKLIGQSTFVPIRTVTEGLGFDVTWQSPHVTIFNGETNMRLTIGSKKAIVNEAEVSLDAPAINTNDTTLVPLRFVSEQFGLDVNWDKQTKSVYLNEKQSEVLPPVTETGPDGDGSSGESPAPDGNGTGSNPENGGETPTGDTATLSSISYDGLGSIRLDYTGQAGQVKTEVLHNPERVVVDVPNMKFDTNFSPGFLSSASNSTKLGEMLTDGHASLLKVRFSLYSQETSTIRVVMDLNAPTAFNIVEEEGALRIDMLEPTGPITVPDPGTVIPPIPVEKGVYKVVIDAGHGDHDPGAISVSKRKEKDFNLAIALKVQALLLKESKLKPYLTRVDDTFIPLDDRVKFANDLKADLFISIHANSYKPETNGTETYYNRDNSRALADIMHKHLVKGTGLVDRKVRKASFKVIKYTTMPAVLLEAGYLSSKKDEPVLFNETTQNRIAAEIVAGIKEYLKIQ
ncbi:N-acetylmuramoyl-L-alanine amidase [Paenibacillus oenotherae]|uniref:N-acetylmuramoyl-L-alanine amidase n=1 Tax=Paenibacillus oenotherae TaxID=1435645 RepID=A0ABS7D2P6_9BACL|nr:N-acetylmuramoyl-L-alanine amidase [Paenibacillus oenotherae]MBW7474129.1 N-acetylmuramoyl-L-alanine amidase [Paenibacillus oenotherae]